MEAIDVNDTILQFQHPFTCIVAGPTKVGKTEWVMKLVNFTEQLISPAIGQVIWCYSEWQAKYNTLRKSGNVKFVQGLPDKETLKKEGPPKLLILDDMMDTLKDNKQLTELFIKGCHHWNVSCIHICQSLFYAGLRTLRINAHYIVLMKSPSDKLQISMLARQMFPGLSSEFMQIYQEATAVRYGYLLIDCSAESEDKYRLRTQIFSNDEYAIFWILN